ncbi:hypothetical protein Q5424_01355 [Conexibacter sp. JD483]|uniref:hypothetical protein n=1 Tax=unclassified Conexibacter TaxID=2627773 RepID=UPI0027160E71|nr:MULTISPECIES: hypothetical protein [unclassified Conexibacter]MDO8185877.1 hypothetical protein [Conexibacter sp. CPCC 205706]MDO8198620.1 hypothetical protein [Conexibacter sp. CPCC 205762]MDR9367706.1 hypothetical protein [Conexibacter sp. JD483]
MHLGPPEQCLTATRGPPTQSPASLALDAVAASGDEPVAEVCASVGGRVSQVLNRAPAVGGVQRLAGLGAG